MKEKGEKGGKGSVMDILYCPVYIKLHASAGPKNRAPHCGLANWFAE